MKKIPLVSVPGLLGALIKGEKKPEFKDKAFPSS